MTQQEFNTIVDKIIDQAADKKAAKSIILRTMRLTLRNLALAREYFNKEQKS